MKRKTIIGLITILSLTLLTGCGKEIEVKNGSKVAVSLGKNKFTATEYYEKIKEDNISTLIDMIDHSILDSKYKTDSKETESIDKQINQIKSNYGQDENTYKSVLQQYFGVDSEEDLRDKLSLEYKRNLAVEDYVKKNIKDDYIASIINEIFEREYDRGAKDMERTFLSTYSYRLGDFLLRPIKWVKVFLNH